MTIQSPIIHLFDTQSGVSIRTIALPPGDFVGRPAAPAPIVNRQTGRVFISALEFPFGTIGRVFVRVYMVDLRTGTIVARTDVLPSSPTWFFPVLLALDEQLGHIFVVSPASAMGTSRVSVLDARRGTLLHTVTLPIMPRLLIVDPQTARVFVFNQDNDTYCVLDAHTGALLATRSLGPPRPGIASSTVGELTVDAATGQLFVIHAYPSVVSMLDGHTGQVLTTITGADMRP
jgi:DNA-binding beta-propeller fold protein YncE